MRRRDEEATGTDERIDDELAGPDPSLFVAAQGTLSGLEIRNPAGGDVRCNAVTLM